MKNFTGFKYQESVLRTVDEPLVKKKFNWDRFSFICLMIAGLCYFAYSYYQRMAYTEVPGLVLLEKMAVNFTDDIRLVELCTKEGDAIIEGDTLFVYTYEDEEKVENEMKNHSLKKTGSSPTGNNRNFLRDKLAIKRQIAIKGSEREGARENLKAKKAELTEQRKQVLMGVDVAHKLPALQTSIVGIETDIRSLSREIRILRKHLAELREEEERVKNFEMAALANQLMYGQQVQEAIYHYVTPTSGVIGQINNSPNEVCYKSENIMVIHQLTDLKIKAYFDQRNIKDVVIGEEVGIEFPDGTYGRGKIDNFYISTYELPPEFQKKYEPTERSVVADIVPINEEEAKLWVGYYKMAVRVLKRNEMPYDKLK